jgi:hypothetical protein
MDRSRAAITGQITTHRTTGGLNLERWTRLGAVSARTGPIARFVVSRSLASASRAGFYAAAAGILGKLPVKPGVALLAGMPDVRSSVPQAGRFGLL